MKAGLASQKSSSIREYFRKVVPPTTGLIIVDLEFKISLSLGVKGKSKLVRAVF